MTEATSQKMTAEEKFFFDLEEKLQDLVERKASFKGIIYGPSGVGKTVLSLQIAQSVVPADKWILYIDSAEGWVSLNNHPRLKNRVMRWTDTRISQLDALVTAITSRAGKFASVGAVIIDEHSSIYDSDLAAITRANAAREQGKDPDTPKWPDMNTAKNRTMNLMGRFIKLEDVHVILLAHDRRDEDNLKRQVISPSYMPKTGKDMRGIVHFVGYMTADEETREDGGINYRREIQVHPTNRVVAKTRIGGFSSIRISPKELVTGIQEWLGGKRETIDKQEVVQEPETSTAENTDEVSNDEIVEELL